MPKIQKRPPITERSEAREEISSLMRLNWLEDASNNAVHFAGGYRDEPFKAQATLELRDAHRLMLELMHDPETKGGRDLGAKYVAQRAEQLRKTQVQLPEPSPRGWVPTNAESEPPF
ncbi:hypothetical protein FDH59_gp36 [Arthrobacter phage Joann]|uniref:Uncharacterized protein n=1 Tax=Arthrobacter phage Joann TaxID=1772303 RepID=A0A0U4IM69_9CAUD|nr:hypothetical protein FDH59_gp36 [Arthrobacter phage Joann]ALY09439.1 hypothetical protein JOANN_36 [Arthrobacter phage Joann]